MCGILGVTFRSGGRFRFDQFRAVVADLFLLSESRGKESAGLAALGGGRIVVLKRPVPASSFVRGAEYRAVLDSLRPQEGGRHPVALIGHSRLVTNGSHTVHENNQPVLTEGIVGVHNGIIVNAEALWRRFPEMRRGSQVDSEIIFSLIRQRLGAGTTLARAVQDTFGMTYGQASIAGLFSDLNCLLLYTNHGSLFMATEPDVGLVLFASERTILNQALQHAGFASGRGAASVQKIMPGTGVIVELENLQIGRFGPGLAEPAFDKPITVQPPRLIEDRLPASAAVLRPAAVAVPGRRTVPPEFERHVERCQAWIGQLRRCARCLLPSTMPHIRFDAAGVCNYCRGYQQPRPKPLAELEELVRPHRRAQSEPDCLVGLSGGRDSSYALHAIKTRLNLNPVAFTYDWGMVTDLARRNVSRMCGKLGVEHILVSANLAQKRANVRSNVLAWLRQPDLGMIPLFMAGDKQYFYHARRVRKELGVGLTLLGENLLERTDFKFGFCGVPPGSKDADRVYVLSGLGKSRMLWHYGRRFLMNPGYWNASVPDTLWAYACYYLMPRDYVNVFRYVRWDEQLIENTLRGEYDWEMAEDTRSSWRIGDGTASFYNYIYYTVAGFSEIDTFRSNQIREGVLTREAAEAKARTENQPRWSSIRDYCDLIEVDFETAIRAINQMARLYPTE